MSDGIISTSNLLGASQMLDRCIDLLRQAQAAGIEVSVEQMTMTMLLDEAEHANARDALILAVALQRLTARQ